MTSTKVQSGLDILKADNFDSLKGQRIGIIANPSAIDAEMNHIVDLMVESENCDVVKLFAPEHGLRGDLQDMEHVQTSEDQRTKLPVISLYGNSLKSLTPTNEALDDVETIVFDLQDVGSRYYTFAQTLAFTMLAAQNRGKKVVVIDRPNPIGGSKIEGSPLSEPCRSFVGLYPFPNRHGLTMGEMATVFKNGFRGKDYSLGPVECELEVIKMQGWERHMSFEETGLPWVQPSPNMPNIITALVYPGMCLFEGTNISEGRGTTKPFELLGAPYIDGYQWAEETLKQPLGLDGAALRPLTFVPKFQKWADRNCGGVQIHVTDPETFNPYRWGLALIYAASALYPERFGWRQESYEFVSDTPAIDLLYGSNNFRRVVETKKEPSILLDEISTFEDHFKSSNSDFHLY